jgi:hypothetical protein
MRTYLWVAVRTMAPGAAECSAKTARRPRRPSWVSWREVGAVLSGGSRPAAAEEGGEEVERLDQPLDPPALLPGPSRPRASGPVSGTWVVVSQSPVWR